ncbi:radical SAM protein [Halanaerobium congolense]|jgi:MoaA/NifB/PqqE/SkfB family radical SAM enzyme|uniref:radical SAM protein n=1 Tax=Halanaerobium congolense TaxID=54121 RepID=UPI00105C609E|nr:radical SAM protein [Halanaerobium congolense]TDP26852.1 MoaA/NifB/PqqE/SkfB family radical SAM enzyme [Halanaerobium congolense]
MKHIALIELTQLCNLKCEYCFYNDYGRKSDYITIEILKKLILPETTDVYLTGGEPFLASNVVEIIKFIRDENKRVSIFSNGAILFKYAEKEFKYIIDNTNNLIITLDDFRNKYKLRGANVVDVLAGIKRVINYKKDVLEVKIAVNNYNIDFFEDTVKKLIKIGIERLSINLVHNISSSKKSFEVKNKEKLVKLFDIIEKFENYFNSNYVYNLKLFLNNQIDELVKVCKAGDDFYFINCEGKVYKCPACLDDKIEDKYKCISKECINLWEMY